jgi:hypothetical protein
MHCTAYRKTLPSGLISGAIPFGGASGALVSSSRIRLPVSRCR